MRVIHLLFILILFLSVGTLAQSKEGTGCGKEKECVKSCEGHGSESGVVMKEKKHVQEKAVIKDEKSTQTKKSVKVSKKKVLK